MCMNVLPSFVNFKKRGVNLSELCLACGRRGKESEITLHVLVKCEVAKRVWEHWENSLVDLLNVNIDIIDIAMKIFEIDTTHDLGLFFGVAWMIWYNRTKIVQESSCQSPNQIWSFARKYIFECKSASIACSQQVVRIEGKWKVPPPGVFKINVDGATSKNGRNSSVGVAIRDAIGVVHPTCCKYLQGQYSVEKVEALDMEYSLLLAKELKLSQIILEFDALIAVTSFIEAETDGCLGHVYQEILSLLSLFSSWKIMHVKRNYNKVAHELEQYARQKEESHV